MARRREPSPQRQMRKVILVICEGETEACYLGLVKSRFRSPVKIVSRVKGASITPAFVKKCQKELELSSSDSVSTFLMYDMDVADVVEKLAKCNAQPAFSNPCFEIWPLLHVRDHNTPISTPDLVRRLRESATVWKNYQKGEFTDTQKNFLMDNIDAAVTRSKALPEHKNPSTDVWKIIELVKQH